MPVKNQGTELNRTLTNFFNPADVGAFNTAHHAIVLKGDADRQLYITGFSFTWRVGIVGDVNISSNLEVLCAENFVVTDNSGVAIFPEINSSLRFAFSENAQFFQNKLEVQFEFPFRLMPSVTYSLVGAYQSGGGAIAAVATSRLTIFGFEENQYNKTKYYGDPR